MKKLLLFVCKTLIILLVFSNSLFSQGVIPTVGTDFWLTYTENFNGSLALQLFITSDQNTSGTVEIPLQSWSTSFIVTANQTTTITIPVAAENIGSNVTNNNGVHVTSDENISLFAINFMDFTADASKILPKISTGTEYTIVSYAGIDGYFSELAIVASEDDTEVEITPTTDILGGVSAGTTYTVSLDAGETYQIQSSSGSSDLTGTTINATPESGDCRPFAVFSGSMCANIPIGCTYCDMVFDQNFPVDSWGTEYLIAPFDFASSYTYKIIASVNGTNVSIDGIPTYTLNAGESVELNSIVNSQYVSANNAINVTQFMQGVSCSTIGDPAMLILNSIGQDINHITFSTVTSTVITDHVVNIVTETNYADQVFLDGTPLLASEFTIFPGLPSYSYAQISITEGSHILDSQEGFSAYVYGIGDAESYAYSVGSYSFEDEIVIYSVNCTGDEIVLSPDVPLFDVWWSTEDNPEDTLLVGESLVLVPPIETQIYIMHGISQFSGCPLEFFFSIESPEEIDVNIIPDFVELCFHEEYTFASTIDPPSPNYVYSWEPAYPFNNPDEQNGSIQPEISGWYSLVVTTQSGCGYGIDSVYVEVIGGSIADFVVSASEEALCIPETTILNVDIQELVLVENFDSGFDPLLWDNISGGVTGNTCGSLDGDALFFDLAGDRYAETVDFDMSTGGEINFAIQVANLTSACDDTEIGDDIVLSYSTNGGTTWIEILMLYEMLYPDYTFMTVTVPVGAETASTRFRWNQVANSGLGTDNWGLDNVSISTTLNNPPNILWTSELGQAIIDPSVIETEAVPLISNYFYCEMEVDGCNYIDSVFVLASDGVNVDLHDTTFCFTLGAQLFYPIDDVSLYSFNWESNPVLDSPFLAYPTLMQDEFEGLLIVTITESATQCEITDSIYVNYGELDIDDLENEIICVDETLLYPYDNQDLFFTWEPNATLEETSDSTLFLTPEQTTSYVFSASNGIDCVIVDTLIISIDTLSFELGMSDTLCSYETLELDFPQFPGMMTWNDGQITTIFTISEEGEYWASVINENNCQYADSISVYYFPEVEILGDDEVACPEDNLIYYATPNLASYLWSDLSTEPYIQPSTTGEYWLIAIDNNNCTFQDSVNLEILDSPLIEIVGIPLICENGSAIMTAESDENNFLWSNQITSAVNEINTPGLYTVMVESDNGCQSNDSILIDQFFFGDLRLPIDTFYCEGSSLELNPNYNSVVVYHNNGIIVTDDITVTQPGLQTIVGDYEICQQLTVVNVASIAVPVTSFVGSNVFCSMADPFTTSIQLISTANNVFFEESLVNGVIEVDESGDYIITSIDTLGCQSEFLLPVIEMCAPIVHIPNSFTPNHDGINEQFFVNALFIDKYEITIFNRWGEIIYFSTDPDIPWLGEVNGGNYYAQNDIYHYIVKVHGLDTFNYEYNGTVSVIR